MRWSKMILAGVAGVAFAAAPLKSNAGVFLNITIGPPAIPVYEQPICPGPDYIWTPGFWQWDANVGDYYWVPGTWVAAPQPGYLWTPGYWAFENGYYGWHGGYWGPHIGFYGGVNYGFGYFGHGYEGGYWNRDHFYYNTAISRVNVVNVHNTYVHNVTVVNNVHTSYVGGNGLQARPTGGEQAALRENHVQPTTVQMQHASFASQNRAQFASVNRGAPAAAAIARPANSVTSFRQNAIAGRAGGSYNPAPAAAPAQQRGFAGAGVSNRFPNNNAAAANREAIGNQAVQQDRQQVQQQRLQDRQQYQQQRQGDRQVVQQQNQQYQQQRQQDRQVVQQQNQQDRQQVQQQRQGDRQQVQQQRQEARPAENRGGERR